MSEEHEEVLDTSPGVDSAQEELGAGEADSGQPVSDESEASSDDTSGTTYQELTPEQQARFDRIYGNMKQNERVIAQQGDMLKTAMDRLRKMEGREAGNIVEDLKAAKVQALDEGDNARVVEIDAKLAQAQSLRTRIDEPPIHQVPVQEQSLTADQEGALVQWAQEADTNGNALRPWANPAHPEYAKVTRLAEAALADPSLVTQAQAGNMKPILAEVDRMMGLKRNTGRATANTLSGTTDVTPPSRGKVTLTADEKIIAKSMGITNNAYLKSKKELGG